MPSGEDRQQEMLRRIGENVRALREKLGMSLADLAREMSDQGWRWHHSTVYKIEHGDREVKGAELYDLAAILRTSVDRFFWTQPEASAVMLVGETRGRLSQARECAVTAVEALHAALAAAERRLAETRDSPYERVRLARDDLADLIGRSAVADAVAEGTARYRQRGQDG